MITRDPLVQWSDGIGRVRGARGSAPAGADPTEKKARLRATSAARRARLLVRVCALAPDSDQPEQDGGQRGDGLRGERRIIVRPRILRPAAVAQKPMERLISCRRLALPWERRSMSVSVSRGRLTIVVTASSSIARRRRWIPARNGAR